MIIDNNDLRAFENFAGRIAKNAGQAIMKLYGKAKISYTKRHPGDIVTESDLLSESIIKEEINKNYPDHKIFCEEDDHSKSGNWAVPEKGFVWVIDPLDGTRNYSTNTPLFCVLICLVHDSVPIAAAAYLPFFDELYTASRGNGSSLNSQVISCCKKDSIYCTYGVGSALPIGEYSKQSRRLMNILLKNNLWMNSIGCIGVSAMMVASGKRDWLYLPKCGGSWDYAATYLILKEAGCAITAVSGREWSLKEGSMIAANSLLHKEFLRLLHEADDGL